MATSKGRVLLIYLALITKTNNCLSFPLAFNALSSLITNSYRDHQRQGSSLSTFVSSMNIILYESDTPYIPSDCMEHPEWHFGSNDIQKPTCVH
jgi:hypothetical protein